METQLEEQEQIKKIWVERGNKSIDEMNKKELITAHEEIGIEYGDEDYELPPSLTTEEGNEQLLLNRFARVLLEKIGDMDLEDHHPDLWQQMKSRGLRRRDVVDIIRDEQDRHVENRFVKVSEIDNYMFNLVFDEEQEVIVRDKTTKRIYTGGEATCQFYLLADLLYLVCKHAPEEDVVQTLTGTEDFWCYGSTEDDSRKLIKGVLDVQDLIEEMERDGRTDDLLEEMDVLSEETCKKIHDCVHFILGTEFVEEKEQ